MTRKANWLIAMVIFALAAPGGAAAQSSLKVTGAAPPSVPPAAPATSGPIRLQASPYPHQAPPRVVTSPPASTAPFERNDSVIDLPMIFGRQWSLAHEVAPENLISERYLRSQDSNARELTLKQAIYIALRNNPALQASALDPIASMEAVRQANGAFDPNLTGQGDITKNVSPTTNVLQSGAEVFTQKNYDWNFGLNKVSAITNGTWGITFDNNRALSNSVFAGINPSYNPTLELSLSQPLLQSFGWDFATINVRIAESGQKQAQWSYGQTLLDFVQKIGGEYWNVVLAEENLEVARAALRFNQDLVRQNAISVKVGTLAPIDLQEAQSAESTAEANVFTAEANLKNARTQLREDVMLNPHRAFLPAEIEPITRPNPNEQVTVNEQRALELAVQYRPSLAGMREAIRSALLQVKYSENQLLPQLNLGTQFGLSSTAGTTPCIGSLSGTGGCKRLPFGGIYGDALNRLWGFSFYNYAAVLTFQYPLDNAVPKAALAQARVQ
ncbi:MAG: TolC family protein, partial [Candidatus Binataceae bacterium]